MTCERCRELEAKLTEAILTYSPYVKALKEAVARVEAERDKALEQLRLTHISWAEAEAEANDLRDKK